jgi:AcrR family transcriptional regulator
MTMKDNESSPRRSRASYAPEETRARLLASALDLFEARGYHGTSVDEVVDRAGLTKGAFYHHFDSKEDLLLHIHDIYIDGRYEACSRIIEGDGTPVEKLRALITAALVSLAEYRPHVTIFLQERRFLVGDRFDAVKKKRDAVDQIYRTVIEQGIADGSMRADLNPQIATFGILGMCAWAMSWFRNDGTLSAAEVGGLLADLVLVGMLSNTPGEERHG